MVDEQTTQKIELSEVMMAMDVVDTIRHQRSLVERELESGDREAGLIEKLKKIYADQGLEVSDQVIADGVKAMREERFAYQPPSGGVNFALARLYVNRGRWAKLAMWLLVVAVAVWAGYRYLYAVPAEKGRTAWLRNSRARPRTSRRAPPNCRSRSARQLPSCKRRCSRFRTGPEPLPESWRTRPAMRWLQPPASWRPPTSRGL